jgi:hypothetical protein
VKLKEGTIQLGDCLHINQYKSSVLGCLSHTMGREKSSLKYSGGLIAVNMAVRKELPGYLVLVDEAKTG